MGVDISGWVETRTHEGDGYWESGVGYWASTVCIQTIVGRNYGMFASLFGIRNGEYGKVTETGRFRAIAPRRGEPPRASQWYTEERDNYGGQVGETWVLWSELAAIDWEKEGNDYLEDGLHHFVDAKGEHHYALEPQPGWRRERRGDYLYGGWPTLFKLMAVLAEQFGADNVRLSVWFDQW